MVQELLNRVVEAFRTRGIEPYWIEHQHKGWQLGELPPELTIHVYQTFRQNHSRLENVTVTIEVTRWNKTTGKRLARLKVPKDASDKVINNRIDKALEYFN